MISTTLPVAHPQLIRCSVQPSDHLSTSQNLIGCIAKCESMSQLRQIHARALRCCWPGDSETVFLFSRILHFSCLHDIFYGHRVFNQIQNRNSFIWNTLIGAYARSSNCKEEALRLYKQMLEEGEVCPDNHSYPILLKACAYIFSEFEGEQAHAQLLKLGLGSDIYISNSLIHFYASCGSLELARTVFDKMPSRTLVSWNALIDGLVRAGNFELSLDLFSQMKESFEPDGYTVQSVLTACGGCCAISSGMWMHAYILKKCDVSISEDVFVNNCLVDMYCKFGSLNLALQVFEKMPTKDLNSWNSIILGLAMYDKGRLALEYFHKLAKTPGLAPNSITFVGVLSACKHSCMTAEGRKYFNLMVSDYKIEPRLEHFGCIIDLLARAGLVEEALEVVHEMPIKPDAAIWRSLLDSCCKSTGVLNLSKDFSKQTILSECGDSSGVYVLLSRVYASANRWNDIGLVRKLMDEKGIRKEPGCSFIEIEGVSNEFFSGDTSHSRAHEIYQCLNFIDERQQMGSNELGNTDSLG